MEKKFSRIGIYALPLVCELEGVYVRSTEFFFLDMVLFNDDIVYP